MPPNAPENSSMPLTDTACKTAKPREDGKPLRLSDEKGMYLEVMPNGSKY